MKYCIVLDADNCNYVVNRYILGFSILPIVKTQYTMVIFFFNQVSCKRGKLGEQANNICIVTDTQPNLQGKYCFDNIMGYDDLFVIWVF